VTIAIAVAVVVLIGAGVAWALARFLHAIARFDDWDEPLKIKREWWK
jgi:Na+/H+ antiporter NhaA